MTDFMAARMTMATSLGFHIVLASIGMVMPWLMVIAHRRWLRTGSDDAYRLTKLWSRGVAIFFATGAVSGTALSFELGVLWPGFMEHAGPIIGMPFSLEGLAFFVEAIALGIYLYGWERLPPKVHWMSGVCVGVAGVASGVLVVSANAWMNSPTGFTWANGIASDIDPWAALLNDAWLSQATHMVLAAFESVGFAVAGVHAILILRGNKDPIHLGALKIALVVGALAAILQPISGHHSAQDVAHRQPAKLAAMEAHFETSKNAPLLIGGIPDESQGVVRYGIEIPSGLSLMAFNDPDAEVVGLNEFPEDERPPVMIVHFAFQTMVALGSFLALFGLVGLFAIRSRQHWLHKRKFLLLVAASTPLGFIALECGWIVTEVGRQPWIIHGVMRTREALTPVPGQVFHFAAFASLYLLIGISTIWMWRRQIQGARSQEGPSSARKRWALEKDD